MYYSYPVPRPYGYSPFAYPPGTMTPDIPPQAAAATFRNPHVPAPKATKASDQVTAVDAGPRTYYNPFVKRAVAASK